MHFWNAYPFVRLAIVFILGILCFDNFQFLWEFSLPVLITLSALIVLLIIVSEKNSFYRLRHFNGLISLLTIFYLGGQMTKMKYGSYSFNHYKNITKKIDGFRGVIVAPQNERSNYYRYELEILVVYYDEQESQSEGIIHLYIRKDSTLQTFRYGDHILVKGAINSISPPSNPSEFDYRKYLSRQHIFGHAFVDGTNIKTKGNAPPNPLLKQAYALRSKANEIIDQNISSKRENAIAKALLLGIKDYLDNDIKQAYSAAGAMHVLAVSGLHVGIIYLIINSLFGRIKNNSRLAQKVFGVVSILIIWFYALVTGLSPSVMRAATMFSLMAASQIMSREGNVYNTLGLAAFVLLTYEPYLIYSVGFQLSFIAVLGIVYLQPRLYRLFKIRSYILDKAWAITCVSMSAQLSTFPLTAHYFHQFPSYFLVSNLVVIPSAFTMLVAGIALLIIHPISTEFSQFIGQLLNRFIWLVNEMMSKVESLPNSLIEWIYLDTVGLVLSYLIIVTLISSLHFRSFKTLLVSCLLGLLFIISSVNSTYQQSNSSKLIFYDVGNNTAIDHIEGLSAHLYLDTYDPEQIELLSFQIDPNRLASHLPPIDDSLMLLSEIFESKQSLTFGFLARKRIILFDSTTFHLDFKRPIEVDLILINNESVKSLKWLDKHFDFNLVVIGNQNSYYYSKKTKFQASELGIKLHSLKEDGALILDL